MKAEIFSRKDIAVIAMLAGAFIFWLCTMINDSGYADDFAFYLTQGDNIYHHHSYADNGFTVNEYNLTYSPAAYPPGFPFFIAVLRTFFGASMNTVRILNACCLLVYVFFAWLILKDKLSPRYEILLVFILAFSPFIWITKNLILSDALAVAFLYAGFFVLVKTKDRTANFILAGILFTCSCTVRSAAVLIIPALLLFDLIKFRRIKKGSIIMSATTVLLIIFIQVIYPVHTGYGDIISGTYIGNDFSIGMADIFGRLNAYIDSFDYMFLPFGVNGQLNHLFARFLLVAAACGFYVQCRKQFSVFEIFFILQFVLLAVFPGFQGIRYLLPVIPLYFYYAASALQLVKGKILSHSVYVTVLVLAAFLFYSFYVRQSYAQVSDDYHKPDMQNFLADLQENVPEDAMVMSAKPRALYLYAHRRGTVFNSPQFAAQLPDAIRKYHVGYLVCGTIDNYTYYLDDVATDTSRYKKLLDESGLQLYEVKK